MLNEKYKNDPRVKIYSVSAEKACEIFEKNSVDYVVSSLPLAFIDKNTVTRILK
jgi:phospholipid N-methyltransferase